MEDILQRLIQGNNEENRVAWAREWKKRGKKVIGVMSSYVPEEVIWAAGMLPWRITGAWTENITQARFYRVDKSCPYSNRVLESFLTGQLDFLDGIVTSNQDSDLLHLWDVLTYRKVVPLCVCLHPPSAVREIDLQFFSGEVNRLIALLEDFAGAKITNDSLYSSMETFNRTRLLLGRVYDCRKREKPPLSGAEVLGLTTAAQVMPRDEFNDELERLLPYLEKREASLVQHHPRLLVISDKLDNPAYLRLVEEDALVAMDDMDTGSRYIIQQVDAVLNDPASALARRYLTRHGGARMSDWCAQVKQIQAWVREFRIDGVLSMHHTYEQMQAYRAPYLQEQLDRAGIPNMALNREYHYANEGQLRTRISAFVEMISAGLDRT